MADVVAAQAALDRIEGILRRRYHYPHPIFEHVAAARTALEEAPKKAPAKAEKAEGPTDDVSGDVTTIAKPKSAASKAQKKE